MKNAEQTERNSLFHSFLKTFPGFLVSTWNREKPLGSTIQQQKLFPQSQQRFESLRVDLMAANDFCVCQRQRNVTTPLHVFTKTSLTLTPRSWRSIPSPLPQHVLQGGPRAKSNHSTADPTFHMGKLEHGAKAAGAIRALPPPGSPGRAPHSEPQRGTRPPAPHRPPKPAPTPQPRSSAEPREKQLRGGCWGSHGLISALEHLILCLPGRRHISLQTASKANSHLPTQSAQPLWQRGKFLHCSFPFFLN